MKNIESVEYNPVNSIECQLDYNQVVLCVVDSVIERLNYAIDNEEVEDKDEIEELLNDSVLHEVIDGCEFVIYTAYHLPIIRYSDNPNYMVDNFGDECLSISLQEGGLSGLHTALAFWALYADVSEKVNDILNEYSID
jgi:hypothetical protein